MRILAILLLLFSVSLAKLKVVATYPWIGELVKEVGKDQVSFYVIAKGTEDPSLCSAKALPHSQNERCRSSYSSRGKP
jgi:ABC-type Zn uptake system ZnuABC Zn-binding protein ZnuA